MTSPAPDAPLVSDLPALLALQALQAGAAYRQLRTAVSAGSVAYVPARVPHRFEDITDDVRVVSCSRPRTTASD
jgi:hypothetical protein